MPLITKYIDYECYGLIKRNGLIRPEKIAKKFHLSIKEIKLIEKINENGKLSTFIQIPILDVIKYTPTAGKNFIFKCDKCGNEFMMTIYQFLRSRNKDLINSLTAETLCPKHLKEKNNLEKYGVKYTLQRLEVKEKIKNTNIKKYGTDNPAKSIKVKNKIKETNLIRYGKEYLLQNQEIKEKVKNTNKKRYGVENPAQNEKVKNKIKQTNLIRYGTNYPTQNEKVKEKRKRTNIERYGVDNPAKLLEIKEKTKNTNLVRYGKEYPSQTLKVKEKIIQTNIERYGEKVPSKSSKIKEKIIKTLFIKGKIPSSRQQRYIFELLVKNNESVCLNYPLKEFALDIAFLNDYCLIEYNGSGHDLNVKLEKITEKEFKKKEIRRSYLLTQMGWKQIYIISSNDKLPDDKVLLNMINLAREYLINTNHTWINIDLDNKCFIFTKEHITISFDSLKTIL